MTTTEATPTDPTSTDTTSTDTTSTDTTSTEPTSTDPTSTAPDAPDGALTEMLRSQMPLCELLGISAVRGDRSEVVLRGAWDPTRCTAGAVLHGGYLMSMADAAGATLAVFNLPSGAITTTIESKTNLVRPVTGGVVTARSTPVHVGRTTIVLQTDLTRDDGKLVSRTTQTQAVIPL